MILAKTVGKKKVLIIVGVIIALGAMVYLKSHSLSRHSQVEKGLTQYSFWKDDNVFDSSIIYFFQQFSRKSRPFDEFLGFISGNDLLKCGIFSIVFWWLWFSDKGLKAYKQRVSVILALMGTFIALLIGRLLVIGMPFRIRPLRSEAFHLTLPYGVQLETLDGYSSFPSDHTILLCAMATSLVFISRKIGVIAFLYAFLLVILPRIYFCFHYPTDILTGAFIGITVAVLTFKSKWMQAQAQRIYKFSETKPALFYPVFFFITYQIASLFNDVRHLLSFASHLFGH